MTLWRLFKMFLKIGCTGFGGFMALLAQVQSYTVKRKKRLNHDDMLNGISLATILPGPVAVNTVAYSGYRIRGWPGAVVAGTAVLPPSFLLMLLLTQPCFQWGEIPAVGRLFMGFTPAVAAVILAAAWNMSLKVVQGVPEAGIAAACILLITVRGFSITIAIIAASGLLGWILFRRGGKIGDTNSSSNRVPINSPGKREFRPTVSFP